ncbi:MAG: RnfH family protein [Moraxellaceae bacterium]|nr:RnfH family protein [Moraxellaceae bacterium]
MASAETTPAGDAATRLANQVNQAAPVADGQIRVEVAYARPDRQWLRALELPSGSTAQQAVAASGILADCPELELAALRLGIFSHPLTDATQVLQMGDRVEIYRPLIIDPKEARRARAEKARAKRQRSA